MRTNDMPGKTRNGGHLINDTISLNTGDADTLNCIQCGNPIPFMSSRENRVDCELNGRLETYHLTCYDIALFGKVTKITIHKMKKLNHE